MTELHMSADDYRAKMDAGKSHEEIETDIIRYMRAVGYSVPDELSEVKPHRGIYMKVSTRRKRADFQGTMMTHGIPDFIICPPGCRALYGLEVKTADDTARPGQQALVDHGVSFIARSVEDFQDIERAIQEREKSRPSD